MEESVKDLKDRNKVVEDYNFKIESYAKRILGLSKDEVSKIRRKAKANLESSFKTLEEQDADKKLSTNVGEMSLNEQIDKTAVQSLVYEQVSDYIDAQNKLNKLPPGFRYQYKLHEKQGKKYLVRCLQAQE